MVTSCPFGTTGFECSFAIYLLPAVLVLIAILFRKNVANDLLGWDFSLIGSGVIGVIGYFILYGIFHNIKLSFIGGLALLLIGGFFLAPILGDGSNE
jgi:hypothetical protein